MNLAQIRTAIRDILTAGGGTNTTIQSDTFWSDSEINAAINRAQTEVYKIIRRARADYFTRILRTTDPVFIARGRQFNPATLQWQQGVGNYQLPPDFVRMKLITDLSSDRVRLIASDIARNEFRVLMNETGGSTAREYLYDILGVRTLVIRPMPQEVRDLEFIYEKQIENLQDFTTGAVDLTNNNSTATFSASADITDLFMVGDELVVGDATNSPVADPNNNYLVIKSIDSTTQVTLENVYLGTTVSGAKFIVSRVSEIPEHHHQLLVCLGASYCFNKGTNPSADSAQIWRNEYNAMIPSLINDVEVRQGSDQETVQAYLEDLYDA